MGQELPSSFLHRLAFQSGQKLLALISLHILQKGRISLNLGVKDSLLHSVPAQFLLKRRLPLHRGQAKHNLLLLLGVQLLLSELLVLPSLLEDLLLNF